ncbi:TPA: hypothetical protein ACIVZW_001469 [Salmonella enterica subsp. enterica serovar Oranienburg]
MTTITRERAQEIFLGNGPEPTASEQRELARIALASLDAERVAVYSVFEDFWSTCKHPYTQDDELKDFSWGIWNACRAAILNGGKS